MPKTYILKKPVFDANRLQKIAKNILDEAKDDRTKALDTYDFFKTRVENDPEDGDSKRGMVECLKIAQSSKNAAIKLVDLFVKMGIKVNDDDKSDVVLNFESLSRLTEKLDG